MAHVKSYSMSGPDGIYLYSNGVRIGGPYPDEDTARRESIRVSQVVGEGSIEVSRPVWPYGRSRSGRISV